MGGDPRAARVEHEAFERACDDAARLADRLLLQRILADNAETEFGRAHGFARIDTAVEAFRARVPIRDYDDLRPWLDRVAAGEPAAC